MQVIIPDGGKTGGTGRGDDYKNKKRLDTNGIIKHEFWLPF